jgi:predicted SprT family Zn-dependent metalloprotease
MYHSKLLAVGNTNLSPSDVSEPKFAHYDIHNFEDSLAYSEEALKDIFISELERVCDIFNKSLLPVIIDSSLKTTTSISDTNVILAGKLFEMKQSQDYSAFYARTDFFDIKYFTGSKAMGTFSSYRIQYQNMSDVKDINSLIDSLNQKGRMGININIHYMRGNFNDYMFDTLRHEMAHAFTHIYFNGLLKALTGKNYDIKPHGREWKWIAQTLGAKPKATTMLDDKYKEEVQKSIEYYNRTDTLVDGKRMKTKKKARFHYHCGCTDYWLTAQRNTKILRGYIYSCKKCGNKLKSLDRKKYVY